MSVRMLCLMTSRGGPPTNWRLEWPRLSREALRSAVVQGRRSGALHVLAALLALIPVLLVGHLLHTNGIGPFGSRRWYVDRDRSYMEFLGYVQVIGAGLLLLVLAVRRRIPVDAGWGAALTVVMLDDALEWHETGGTWLERTGSVPAAAGLRSQDLGELLTWGVLAAAVLVVLLATHRRSTASARRDSWRLGALIGLLVVFAVGVDMAHIALGAITTSSRIDLLALWLESSGEVGAMAALLAYAVHMARRSSDDPAERGGAGAVAVRVTAANASSAPDARADIGAVRRRVRA